MPRVPQSWLNAVIYLYPTRADAEAGSRSGGTGFLVGLDVEDSGLPRTAAHIYAVTNAHVIEQGRSAVIRLNLESGGFDVLDLEPSNWIRHPDGDDLAIAPIVLSATHRYSSVPRSMILSRELQQQWDFGPGDETFFIGRYVDLDGNTHNVPTVRHGTVAVLPAEPIYQQARDHHQDSILIEARSLSGFSGSPVFVSCAPYIKHEPENDRALVVAVTGAPCYLLGIDWGHHSWTEPVRDQATGQASRGKKFVRTNSGMMMVVPAEKLLSFLDRPELVASRREVEKRRKQMDASGGESADLDARARTGGPNEIQDLGVSDSEEPKGETAG